MTDLAEFLLARIAEDVVEAEDIHQADKWSDGCSCDFPQRWLIECDAKRQILERHRRAAEFNYVDCDSKIRKQASCGMCGTSGEYDEPWPCATLRLLALPYASHSGYREEWRP